MKFKRPDAIVVGSGAGGGTAARALTARGLSVVVFEKGQIRDPGDYLPFDELQFSELQSLAPGLDDPQTYVDASGRARAVQRWWAINAVGGATTIWESNLPRYTQEDFASRTLYEEAPLGASQVDWPWTYDEFQPYFERAEWEWGVSGKVRQGPAQEIFREGYEYPMPPLRLHASTPFLMEIFQKRGMFPYVTAKGINSQTYDSRPACPFCGFCQGFGCAVNDRASSGNTVLLRALATGLCDLRTGTCVTRIDHVNGRVRGVFYKTDLNGPELHLAAPIVVISVQAIESARLFLLSEVPDPHDLVGHYLTYHTKGTVEAMFRDKPPWNSDGQQFQPKTAIGSLQLRDLYVINDPAVKLRKGGKFTFYDPYTTSTPIKAARNGGRWGKALVERLNDLRSHAAVGLSFTGEAMSVHSNRVELDPEVKDPWGLPVARTFYQHHDYDVELSRYCLTRVAEILRDAGGDIVVNAPQDRANPGYGHNHGTLRSGADPATSVLDPMCQSHLVSGLYVLDCAWMPTSGASNPTLSLIANAYRVCDKMPPPR